MKRIVFLGWALALLSGCSLFKAAEKPDAAEIQASAQHPLQIPIAYSLGQLPAQDPCCEPTPVECQPIIKPVRLTSNCDSCTGFTVTAIAGKACHTNSSELQRATP